MEGPERDESQWEDTHTHTHFDTNTPHFRRAEKAGAQPTVRFVFSFLSANCNWGMFLQPFSKKGDGSLSRATHTHNLSHTQTARLLCAISLNEYNTGNVISYVRFSRSFSNWNTSFLYSVSLLTIEFPNRYGQGWIMDWDIGNGHLKIIFCQSRLHCWNRFIIKVFTVIVNDNGGYSSQLQLTVISHYLDIKSCSYNDFKPTSIRFFLAAFNKDGIMRN